MKNTGIYKWLLAMKQTLAPMPWGQRVRHIWTNYKATVIVALVVVLLLGTLLVSSLLRRDALINGVHANVSFSADGQSYLSSHFFDKCEGDPDAEKISVLSVTLTEIADDAYFEMNYYYLKSVLARYEDREIDYILSDKVALEIFLSQNMLLDLRELFTTEELVQMEDCLIYFLPVDENGDPTVEEQYPVAVDVSQLPFFKECSSNSDEPLYFSVASNTLNLEMVRRFWDHLCEWNIGGIQEGAAS